MADTKAETIYDVAVIGGGPAGYTAAIRGAEYGLKVALIDASPKLGGTCLHVGCIPTKALLFNAELWDHLKEAEEFGIKGVEARTLDWAAVLTRKNAIITKHVKGLEFLMKKHKITVIPGFGRLTGPAQDGVHTVDVDANGAKSQVKAKNVIARDGVGGEAAAGIEGGRSDPDQHRDSGAERAAEVADRDWRGRGGRGVCVDLPELRNRGDDSGVFAAHGSGGGRGDFEGAGAASSSKRGIETNTGAKVEKVEKTATACR